MEQKGICDGQIGASGVRVAGRPELFALSSFVQIVGANEMTAPALRAWLGHHLVGRELMKSPSVVSEPPHGVIVLAQGAPSSVELAKLCEAARNRVLAALRAFASTPSDDRFLSAAIYAGRVQRRDGAWTARPSVIDRLSDLVLALAAVDILSHREEYERALSICKKCGRISLDTKLRESMSCIEHDPRMQPTLPAVERQPDLPLARVVLRPRPR